MNVCIIGFEFETITCNQEWIDYYIVIQEKKELEK